MGREARMSRVGIAIGLVLAMAAGWAPAVGSSSHPDLEPRQKTCFGNPPQQTWDPISPPCVPFFDGDNGDSTARGVTGDEVTIVFYNDLGISGDMTTPWVPTDDDPAGAVSGNGQTYNLVLSVKTLLNWYQARYQTYNRRIRVLAFPSQSGVASHCAERVSDAQVAIRDLDPFAFATFGSGMQCFVSEVTHQGYPIVGDMDDMPADVYGQDPNLAWSFGRDLTESARMTASFICGKLKDRPAKMAGDPALSAADRRIALLYPQTSQRGPEATQQAIALIDALKRCGLHATADASSGFTIRPFVEAAVSPQPALLMAEMKALGVTTILCYCVPVSPELSVASFQSAATVLGYSPEWFFDNVSRMYRPAWHRRYSVQGQRSFGWTPEWRISMFESGSPYKAFKEAAPGADPNRRFLRDIYYMYAMLFHGLQTAGPNLTETTLGHGMRTLSLTGDSHFLPVGSLGTQGGGNPHTYQRGALVWTWDPAGIEPGSSQRAGCLRSQGHLAIDGHFQPGDDDIGMEGFCLGPHMEAGPGGLPI